MTTENTNAHALSAAQLDKIAAEIRQRHLSPTEVAALLAMARRTLAAEERAAIVEIERDEARIDRDGLRDYRNKADAALAAAEAKGADAADMLSHAKENIAGWRRAFGTVTPDEAVRRFRDAEAKVARLEAVVRPVAEMDECDTLGSIKVYKSDDCEGFDFGEGYSALYLQEAARQALAPPADPAPTSDGAAKCHYCAGEGFAEDVEAACAWCGAIWQARRNPAPTSAKEQE